MYSGLRTLLLILLAAQLAACWSNTSPKDTEMSQKADQLTRITRAVAGYNGEDHPSLEGTDLVAKATAHDPSLMEGFEQNTFRTKWIDHGTVVVLLCNPDGTQGLIEDISCRPQDVEKHLWRNSPPAPCKVTIENTSLCTKNGGG
jgi:hypothetical protein